MDKRSKYRRVYKTDRDVETCEEQWNDFIFTPLTFTFDKDFYQPDIARRQDLSIRTDKNGTKYINLYQLTTIFRLFNFRFYLYFDGQNNMIKAHIQKPKPYMVVTAFLKGFFTLFLAAGILGLFVKPSLFAGYWFGYIVFAVVAAFFWADWWLFIKPLWKTVDEFMAHTFGAHEVDTYHKSDELGECSHECTFPNSKVK